MASATGDRNLLFGILALQMDFISRDAWSRPCTPGFWTRASRWDRSSWSSWPSGPSAAPCWKRWSRSTSSSTATTRRRAWPPSARSARSRDGIAADRRPRRAGQPGPRPGRPPARRRPLRHAAALGRRPPACRGLPLPHPATARRGRPGQGVRGPRRGTAPRCGAQRDPGAARRPPGEPVAVPGRGGDHRRPGASGHRAGLRPGQYADGRPFYAMRFIKGDSLKEAIERFHKMTFTTSSDGMMRSGRSMSLSKSRPIKPTPSTAPP